MISQKIFLDTQILISAIQENEGEDIKGSSISSVAASEFLGVLGKTNSAAKYYIPIFSAKHLWAFGMEGGPKRDHPYGKHHTDSLLMDFGGQFPTVVHFGNFALSELINNQALSLFDSSISHLNKAQRKTLRKKFEFLIHCELNCVPVSSAALNIAQYLLAAFTDQHSLKKDFRNSWNDLLIAATSIESSGTLYTKDDLLLRYVAQYLKASTLVAPRGLKIDFFEAASSTKIRSRERKEYVNKGWRYSFSKNQKKI